jgi:hypothetical protein
MNYVNHKTPFNKRSKIYIIIDNNFFYGKSDYLVQIHVESNQIKDRSNGSNIRINHILEESEALSDYFYNELIINAKGTGVYKSIYMDYLLSFGFSEAMFEFYNVKTPVITLIGNKIAKMPDVSRFTELTELTLIDCGINELNESIVKLENLYLLALRNNKITKLPNGIGKLKNLVFINLLGNDITYIPDDIKNLDPSNGGSLHMLKMDKTEKNKPIYNKLKELLPNVII